MIPDLILSCALFSLLIATAFPSLFYSDRLLRYAIWRSEQANRLTQLMQNTMHAYMQSGTVPNPDMIMRIQYPMPCRITIAALATTTAYYPSVREISFSVTLADTKQALAIAGDCGGSEPLHAPQSNQPGIALPAQSQSASIDALHGYLYVGIQAIDDQAQNFFTYALADSGLLELRSSSRLTPDIVSLDATRDFVFAALASSTRQFGVIDISDPLHPQAAALLPLPSVTGSYPFGRSIAYYYPYVFIGTHRTAGKEFHAFDVTNPHSPAWMGALELNHNINDIAVRWPYAFLASSGNTEDIIVLNISNPSLMTKSSSLSFAGNEDTLSVFISGTMVYAGRAKSTAADRAEVMILDATSIETIKSIGSYKTAAPIVSLYPAGQHVFAASADARGTLFVLSANQSQPILLGRPIADIDYENNTLFAITRDGMLYALPTSSQ